MTKHFDEMNQIIENARRREKDDSLDYENHHVVPRSLGGDDSDANMVLLTTKEHFIVHKLLFEHYRELDDPRMISTGQAYWLMSTRGTIDDYDYEVLRKIQKKCAAIAMRKTMTGKMPARDKHGNKYHVSVNDPRVLSGELFHHTKGRKKSKEEAMASSLPGELNSQYCGLTDDDIVNYGLELFHIIKEISSINDLRIWVKMRYNKNIPKSFTKFRFPNKSYYEILEEKTNTKYNIYKRGEKLKIYQRKFKRALNDNN